MIKETERTIKKKEQHRYCDFCSLKAEVQYESNTCSICKRDVCKKHKIQSLNNDSWSDYTDFICLECFEISKPFHEKMKELEEQSDKLYEEMEFKCKENRKNKLKNEVK